MKNKMGIRDSKNIDVTLRVLNTLALIMVYRLATYVALPGVSSDSIDTEIYSFPYLINLLTGGAFIRESIIALGILPCFVALGTAVLFNMIISPFMRFELGLILNRGFNFLFMITTVLCAAAYSYFHSDSITNAIYQCLILVAGAMALMWLTTKVTERGIGNGVYLIILVNIISQLITRFGITIGNNVFILLIELVCFLLVIISAVLIANRMGRVQGC
jgi:preprotein translocase subunit SecY